MYILGAILAFSVLVIVHELGHFTLAKLNGVKVEEFSIGMGPKVFGIKGKETEYLIKALPFGGYVKMLGEEEKVSDIRAFSSKTPARKLSIIAAGPIMNFVLAVVIFAVIGAIRGFLIPVIDKVDINSPAYNAGIQKGDKIININNKKVTTWDDFSTVVYMAKGENLNIKLLRNNEIKTINVTPVMNKEENRYIVGVWPTLLEKPNIINSLYYGLTQTNTIIKQTFGALKTIFTGKASADDFGGPISIIRISTKVAESGIIPLAAFAAYLSVQLAIFNIIPFPALDGGWIFLLLFEIITRKKIDDNKIGLINYIGFAILITLMIVILIKDILYPIKL
ncbi:RIP metalloprotease RseP [Clostridium sp. SYSU_GA19001]|uniref:RIP metalloprotease RseP n=1 Tax=Clostridium caldaquaticum TaxID=2940653 RepID=UPI0020772C4E|nr:RIP metalloprotease RseP [Clostridium caldaquaticum]